MGERVLEKSEVRLDVPRVEIDADECKGCGLCVSLCPTEVLVVSSKLNKYGYHPASYKGQGCTGCGVCFYTCPEPGAITVYKKGYLPEEE